jgi:hypothetical protein
MSRGLEEPSEGEDVGADVPLLQSYSLTSRQANDSRLRIGDMSAEDGKHDSLDSEHGHGNVLKGDVTIGTIAGEEARIATEQEHNLSFLEAVKLYPTAVVRLTSTLLPHHTNILTADT